MAICDVFSTSCLSLSLLPTHPRPKPLLTAVFPEEEIHDLIKGSPLQI